MVVRTENVIQSTLPRGDHSLSGVYFQNRNTSNMNQNRCKGKNNQKKKKVKDTFDDKLELGKFHSVFSEKIRL